MFPIRLVVAATPRAPTEHEVSQRELRYRHKPQIATERYLLEPPQGST